MQGVIKKPEISRLTDKEQRLIQLCREAVFGRLELVIKNGEPVKIEWLKQSIEL